MRLLPTKPFFLLPGIFALGSGLLLYFSSPGTVGQGWSAWIALIPLLLAVRGLAWPAAALLGLLAGIAYYLPLLHWITIALGQYGGLHPLVAATALALLALYMSLYLAVFMVLLVTLTSWGRASDDSDHPSITGSGSGLVGRNRKLRGTTVRGRAKTSFDPGILWAAPVIWVALDFIRSWLFTGFPWQDLGYSQYQIPALLQVADLTGHHGVTFVLVLTNALLALLFSRFWPKTWRSHPPTSIPRASLAPSATIQASALTTPRASGSPLAIPPSSNGRQGKSGSVENYAVSRLSGAEWGSVLAALLLVFAFFIYGHLRLLQISDLAARSPTVEVAVIQGNIPQEEKWEPKKRAATVERYIKLSAMAATSGPNRPDLIVWPETALPFYPLEHPLFHQVVDFALGHDLCLLVGAPHREREPDGTFRYYNSALLISPELPGDRPTTTALASVYRHLEGMYHKRHLVPFGEYVPLRWLLPFLAPVVETMGDFTPGSAPVILNCRQWRLGTIICFEAIFPRLARQMTEAGADLLVNITNDAWFGRSNASQQHLSMTVLRAVENRRSLARAANTGISAFVGPDGRIHQATELFIPEQRRAALPLLLGTDDQGYRSIFSAGGYLFGHFCLLLMMAGLIRRFYLKVS